MGSPYYRVRLLFETIMRKVESIDDKVSVLIQQGKTPGVPGNTVLLSVGLQETRNVLGTFNRPVSASEVAAVTGRAREVESGYLNQLFRMGLAEKEKQGQKRVFSLREK
jgi:DNA-binding transcriptional ArsR family regulator